jgi:hypothetical protein
VRRARGRPAVAVRAGRAVGRAERRVRAKGRAAAREHGRRAAREEAGRGTAAAAAAVAAAAAAVKLAFWSAECALCGAASLNLKVLNAAEPWSTAVVTANKNKASHKKEYTSIELRSGAAHLSYTR